MSIETKLYWGITAVIACDESIIQISVATDGHNSHRCLNMAGLSRLNWAYLCNIIVPKIRSDEDFQDSPQMCQK